MFKVTQQLVLVFIMLSSFVCADPIQKATVDSQSISGVNPVDTANLVDIVEHLPRVMSVTCLQDFLKSLIATPVTITEPEMQQKVLITLVPIFISCAQEHALQALHDFSEQISWLEYRKYHWFKSMFVQPTKIFYANLDQRYNQLIALRDSYFNDLGYLTQLSATPMPAVQDTLYEWVGMIAATTIKPNDYLSALESLNAGCDRINTCDRLFCKREVPLSASLTSAAYWTGRTGLSLGMCAGGGLLIGKYLANLNSADIKQVKENYKRAVRNFHTQFVIPNVTNADIDRAAENLDAAFLEDKVIPAVTHRVRTVNDWIPKLVQRVADKRRQWMPKKIEAVLRKIPARTIAVATTLIWLADKTVVDILPWGVETAVGVTAWMGTAAFIDRVVAVADALVTAAGGVSVAPDMGMLLALVYKKKMKLAVLKYGGGMAGFAGLYALYRTIATLNESKLSERLTRQVHGMMATLAPYSKDTTGLTLQPIDLGKVLHNVDEIKRELSTLAQDKQSLFENDIIALQSLNTSVDHRMQLLDSMYKTYSLATIAV